MMYTMNNEICTDAVKSNTLSASSPAWMTGPNTVSVSRVSANISGIWSNKTGDNVHFHNQYALMVKFRYPSLDGKNVQNCGYYSVLTTHTLPFKIIDNFILQGCIIVAQKIILK